MTSHRTVCSLPWSHYEELVPWTDLADGLCCHVARLVLTRLPYLLQAAPRDGAGTGTLLGPLPIDGWMWSPCFRG